MRRNPGKHKIRKYAKKIKRIYRRKRIRRNKKYSKSFISKKNCIRWEKVYLVNPRIKNTGGYNGCGICNMYPSVSLNNPNLIGEPFNVDQYPETVIDVARDYDDFNVKGFEWVITL